MMIKNIYFMFFVALFMFTMAACTSQPKEKFKNLSADEFERMITEDTTVQCLDARTAEEYNEGHIKGCVNIDVKKDTFAEYAEAMLDKKHAIAVYCRSGKRSRKAAHILVKKGYRVYNLDKGIENWKELGKEIEL